MVTALFYINSRSIVVEWGEGVVLDSIQRPGEVQYNQIYLHCEICDAYQHDNTTNGLEEKIEEKYEKAE